MEHIKQKEIYLVPFPFSDFTLKKVRPVLILSNDEYNKTSDDVIICSITRTKSSNFGIDINNTDIVSGNILENSFIKIENICFMDKSLLIKKIALLNNDKFVIVKEKLFEII